MSSKNNRILYVGATDDIKRRTFEHRLRNIKHLSPQNTM
ncbi:GIY-YIG nuclease family protein [Nonlabens ulvanivorans]|nr:GIY-YIG nuclease family protein [Nonlabens ulvanivorans]WOI24236.1 hypothetical protein R1T42_00985 [Nonlabens ulvanivorans]